MSIFRFKKFSVTNEKSAMKVNTDGVLLGAIMEIRPEDKAMLDIGTGTGTIALMAAQRREEYGTGDFHITGIDIDQDSAEEAASNFSESPWSGRLEARLIPFDEFSADAGKFDLIFSNPPYFDISLPAPEKRRCDARHTNTLSYREILEFSAEHLNEEGRLAMVLPSDLEKDLLRYARMCGMGLTGIMRIKTVPRKAPSRIIAEFRRGRQEDAVEKELTIQNRGHYTEEYLKAMKDFYLFA